MARAFILVLDSFGLGWTPDALEFGDEGANTFGQIARWCAAGGESDKRLRSGPLHIPNMIGYGLGHALELATGAFPAGIDKPDIVHGFYAACKEQSKGKETTTQKERKERRYRF